jgi:hypothetical protein
MAERLMVNLNSTETSTTHLLYDGDAGWIEAKRVFEQCWIDINPESDGYGWEFKSAEDCIRWLRA